MLQPNKKLISIAVASLLSMAVTSAYGNESTSTSTGANNAVGVNQSGHDLISVTVQAGDDNVSAQ